MRSYCIFVAALCAALVIYCISISKLWTLDVSFCPAWRDWFPWKAEKENRTFFGLLSSRGGVCYSTSHSRLALLLLWQRECGWSATSKARPELRCPSQHLLWMRPSWTSPLGQPLQTEAAQVSPGKTGRGITQPGHMHVINHKSF